MRETTRIVGYALRPGYDDYCPDCAWEAGNPESGETYDGAATLSPIYAAAVTGEAHTACATCSSSIDGDDDGDD